MQSRITLSLLAAAGLTVQTAWAACTNGLDMNGNSILNATMTGVETPSPVVTTDYVKKILKGNNGFTVSNEYLKGPTESWYHSMAYCENLASADRLNPDGPVYTDWRLPSASEMFAFCKQDGVMMVFHDEYKLVKLPDQNNDMNTMVVNAQDIDTKYYVNLADFCRKLPDDLGYAAPPGKNYAVVLRDIYYTYDGFDSKFFSKENPRGRLTTNYSIVSSFEPYLSHTMKAPLPLSAEINTQQTLHTYCVR